MADAAARRTGSSLLILVLMCFAWGIVLADEEGRSAVTTQMTKAERASGSTGRRSIQDYPALLASGSRASDKQAATRSGAPQSARSVARSDFWIYSADVVLFNDHDNDGHFHGIDLLFDADTYYVEAEVYAVVYLSLEGGPWNEYSVTDNFTLFGASADDEFQIVSDLVSGYPTGSYDLLIELFDGYNDAFLASYGPADTPALAFLPLEDSNRDTPFMPPTVIVDGGGGAMSWWLLFMVLASRRCVARYWPAP